MQYNRVQKIKNTQHKLHKIYDESEAFITYVVALTISGISARELPKMSLLVQKCVYSFMANVLIFSFFS